MDHKVDRAIDRAFFHISFAPPYRITQLHSSIGVSSIPGALLLGSAMSAVCTSSHVISGCLSHVHGILSTDGFVVPDKAGGSPSPVSS